VVGAFRRTRLAAALLVACGMAAPAWAQHPHGTPPGLANKGGKPGKGHSGSSSGSSGGSSSTGSTGLVGDTPGGGPISATSRIRSLGVWLDDATLMAPEEAWLTVSMQRWASPIGSGFDGPIFDAVTGVTERAHVFVSVPYSRVTYTGYATESELGTVYVGSKIGLWDPSKDGFGASVSPAVEFLSPSAVDGTGFSRVNLVLPASLEWRAGATRVYGSTGYFTRGAVFLGGAVERSLSDAWVVTGALSQAWSTGDQALSETLGLRANRTDASGSVSWIASSHLMIFGSVARTLSPLDADSTRYALSGGVSINLDHPGRRIPLAKP
jgi:hypothetical protein